jgi:putative DNA primase/helicase
MSPEINAGPPGILPHHLAELRKSGLNDSTIVAAGIRSESDYERLAAVLGWKCYPKRMAPAIVFPFRAADGTNGYSRIKADVPRLLKEKPVKYESPKGRPNEIYLPPGVADVLGRSDVDLLLTEGEKKSLKATQEGYPCIGLVGVWGWKTSKGEKILPPLEDVAWKGRKVWIVFDSDAVHNSQVGDAQTRLAKHLVDRGAEVRIAELPFPVDESGKPVKVGLDDFLVAQGPDALRKILEDAPLPKPVSPLVSKSDAKELDPGYQAKAFLIKWKVDGVYRLRFWRGTWWKWEDGCYRERENSEARAALVRQLDKYFVNLTMSITSNVPDVVKALAELSSRNSPPMWFEEPINNWPAHEILAMRGVLVHLPSLVAGRSATIDATPQFFTTAALDYNFDIEAPKPTQWLRFIDQLFPDDPESVATLQEWFGYVLTPDTRQQKIFMLIGPPRSGKGTIARVLQRLIGLANCAGPTLASFETNFGLSALLGKSLAIIADARLSSRVDQSKIVERLLSISGEDVLTVDRKYRESSTGKIPARLMIVSNELPRLAESSGALANRMVIVRLTQNFLGKEDPQLTDKLLTELPGILLWAIAGWQRLRERGYFVQPKSAAELAGEMEDLCSPIAIFVRECCDVGPNNQAPVDDLYAAWVRWCEANGRDRPGNVQTFGRDLRSVVTGLRSARPREGDDRYRAYDGIRLRM